MGAPNIWLFALLVYGLSWHLTKHCAVGAWEAACWIVMHQTEVEPGTPACITKFTSQTFYSKFAYCRSISLWCPVNKCIIDFSLIVIARQCVAIMTRSYHLNWADILFIFWWFIDANSHHIRDAIAVFWIQENSRFRGLLGTKQWLPSSLRVISREASRCAMGYYLKEVVSHATSRVDEPVVGRTWFVSMIRAFDHWATGPLGAGVL